MSEKEIITELVEAWKINNKITLELLKALNKNALSFKPSGRRRRSISQQFAHMHHARYRWLLYYGFEDAKLLPELKGKMMPGKKELQIAFRLSGRAVEIFLRSALNGKAKVKYFRQSPVRWMTYLVSHESHHRGQIILSLKQAGFEIPDAVAVNKVWGLWASSK